MPRENITAAGDTDDAERVMVSWDTAQPASGGEVRIGVGGDDSAKWIALNRHGVNRLIRSLRRARNRTFGVDE